MARHPRPPNLTSTSLAHDLAAFVGPVAGGRHADFAFAPCTIEQYSAVLTRLNDFEAESWTQAVMRLLPAGSTLATLYVMTDRGVANLRPLARAALRAGIVRVFA